MEKEIFKLKNELNELNAEKTALDQTYVEALKTVINLRKDIILQNQMIQNLASQLSASKAEKDTLVTRIQDLESSLAVKAS